jgi:stearoyl-CoA 9-desaturase NADPH oxidoreductase
VHLHCSRSAENVIFARELAELRERSPGYRLELRITSASGRLKAAEIDGLCGDWRERETFLCGPGGLLDAVNAHWSSSGDPERLHVEHFQPDTNVGEGERGTGGTILFRKSKLEASSDGEQPILHAGESAGATLPFGCRMGICHSCVGRLRTGQVRDLRTGRVHGQPGELLRTCINAPEGAVEIDL